MGKNSSRRQMGPGYGEDEDEREGTSANKNTLNEYIRKRLEINERKAELQALSSCVDQERKKILALKSKSESLERNFERSHHLKARLAFGYTRTERERNSESKETPTLLTLRECALRKGKGGDTEKVIPSGTMTARAKSAQRVLTESVVGAERMHRRTHSLNQTASAVGYLDVRGFNPAITMRIHPMHSVLQTAAAAEMQAADKESVTLRHGRNLYMDLRADLVKHMQDGVTLSHRLELRSQEARAVQQDNKLRELECFAMKLSRDEMSLNEKKILRHKVRNLFKAWRMVCCREFVECAALSKMDPFIKRVLLKQKQLISKKELYTDDIGVEMWRASVFPPSTPATGVDIPSTNSLRLTHVYGYRGRDCAGNILRLRNGDIVYHVAGLGVVHQLNNHDQRIFQGHRNQAITCIALHPDGLTVATGSCGCTDKSKRGIICVWSKVNDTVTHMSSLNGEEIDSVSCICFSKTGRYIFAVGGRWPCMHLEVYEWESTGQVVGKGKIGAEHILAISCNPFSDALAIMGLGSLKIWRFVAVEIERFRYSLGIFRWNLLQSRSVLTEDASSMSAIKSLYIPFIESCYQDGLRFFDTARLESAKAAIECGIFCCQQLTNIIASCQFLPCLELSDQKTKVSAASDSFGFFSELEMLSKNLKEFLRTSLLRRDQETSHYRGDLDREIQSILIEIREDFASLPVAHQIKMRQEFEYIEREWNNLVEQGRNGMVSTNCCAITPLGKTLWKTSERLLTATSVQALLCIAFCGPTSFVTGAEDGSLLLWENEELVNVFPLHRGLLIDISIDCRDINRAADHPFYLVTAGNDGTVRFSRCIGHQLYQERCVLMPSAAVSVCNFYGVHKSSGLEFTGNRGYRIDRDRDEGRAPFSKHSKMQVKINLDHASEEACEDSLAQIFVVGTVDNNVYTVDFGSESGIKEIVCGHREGRIICLSREANSGHQFYTVGEDGLVRLWDAHQVQSLNSWRAMDAYEHEGIANHSDLVSCAELSQDGKWLIIGFASGQMLIFNAHKREFQRLISKEFEVEVQMPQMLSSCCPSSKQILILISQKSPGSVEDRIRLDRLEKLYRAKQDIEKSLLLGSLQFYQEDLETVKRDIDSLESKIKAKAEAGMQGLNLIPAELSLLQGLRLKIGIFQSAHKDEGLDQDDFSRFSECNSCLNRLLHDPNTISEVNYELSTGLYHIKLERAIQTPSHGQKLTLQKKSFRVSSSVGKFSIIRISPDNIFVAVCGERGAEIRFLARLHEHVCKIKCMEGIVTHMDWAKDSRHLQVNSSGNHLCFWKLRRSCGKWECTSLQPKDAADIKWATFSCSMGWAAQGLLSSSTDRRHLIVKSNAKQNLVAVGNDQGSVFLNPYPQWEDDKDRIVHQCHAAAISALIFLGLGNMLVSTSAGDLAILQWDLTFEKQPLKTLTTKVKGTLQAKLDLDKSKDEKKRRDRLELQSAHSSSSSDKPSRDALELSIILIVLKRDVNSKFPIDLHILQDAFSALIPRQSLLQVLQVEHKPALDELRVQIKSNFISDLLDLKGLSIDLSSSSLESVTVEQVVLESDIDGFEHHLKRSFSDPGSEASDLTFTEMDNLDIEVPDVNLDLFHVFGYENNNVFQKIAMLKTKELIFYHGRNIIICRSCSKGQRIFCGHQHNVSSLTVHKDVSIVATADSGPSFTILIWDPINLTVLKTLEYMFTEKILGLDFCRAWSALAVITGDRSEPQCFNLKICDWKKNVVLISAPCCCPDLNSFSWNYYISDCSRQQIVTLGGSQILFWSVRCAKQHHMGSCAIRQKKMPFSTNIVNDREVWEMTSLVGDCGRSENIQKQLCFEFIDSNSIITGTDIGKIYLWKASRLYKTFTLHNGPVRGLSVNNEQCSIASCGDDSVKISGLDLENVLVVILNLRIVYSDEKFTKLGFVAQRSANTLAELRTLLTSNSGLLDSKFSILQFHSFFFVVTTQEGSTAVHISSESSYFVGNINPHIAIMFDCLDENQKGNFESSFGYELQNKYGNSTQSVLWTGCSLSFATDDAIYLISNLSDCRCISATRITYSIEHKEQFCALCPHPELPMIVTATKGYADATLQIWSIPEKKIVHRHVVHAAVFALDICPDGSYLAVGKEGMCEIYFADSFEKLDLFHTILYQKDRKSSVTCLKFSNCANYLAIGTSDSGIDVFDVYGRQSLAKWVSSHVRIDLAPDALENELADGVILGYLIESLCNEHQIHLDQTKILKLRSFMIETEHPPCWDAWKNRPSSRKECLSLLSEAFELAQKIAKVARLQLQAELEKLVYVNTNGVSSVNTTGISSNSDALHPARNPQRSNITTQNSEHFLLKQLNFLQSIRWQASKWLSESGKAKTKLVFEILNGLKALELDNTIKSKKLIDLLVQCNNRMSDIECQEVVSKKAQVEQEKNVHDIILQINAISSSKMSNSTASKSQIVRLEEKLASVNRVKAKVELNLAGLQDARRDLAKKINALEDNIKLATEQSFIMIHCSRNSGSPGAVTHIDWSSDSKLLRSCTFKGDLTTSDLGRRYQKDKCESEEWATYSCIRGLSVKHSMMLGEETEVSFPETVLLHNSALALLDHTGHLYLSKHPVDMDRALCCFVMDDAFVNDVGYDRFSVKVVHNLIDPICDILNVSRKRFRVARTSPNTIHLQIGARGIDDKHQHCAMQVFADLLRQIRNFRNLSKPLWLKYVVSVQGPLCGQRCPHSSKLKDIRYVKQSNLLVTIGESDSVLCLFRAAGDDDTFESRLAKVQSQAQKAAYAALQALQLGEGRSIMTAIENLITSFVSVPIEDIKQAKADLTSQLPDVQDMSIEKIRIELSDRHVSDKGVLERHDLVELLRNARVDPASMKISEIKAELEISKVSTRGLFERKELINELLIMRKDSKDKAKKFGPDTHGDDFSVSSAGSTCLLGGRRLPTREEVLKLFDMVSSLDRRKAQLLLVNEELGGTRALLEKYRFKLANACMNEARAVTPFINKESQASVASLKNPFSIDAQFDINNEMSHCPDSFLIKGGELYQLAIEAVGGSISHESIFEFGFSSNRLYQYLRYDKEHRFLDKLHEQFHDFNSVSVLRQSGSVIYVPYHKSLRWGLSIQMKRMGNIIESLNELEQQQYPSESENVSGLLYLQCPTDVSVQMHLKYPTSLLYELPHIVPMSTATNYSYGMLESLFHEIDVNHCGSLDIAALKLALHERGDLSQILGIARNTSKCQEKICKLLFCFQRDSSLPQCINLKVSPHCKANLRSLLMLALGLRLSTYRTGSILCFEV